MTVKTVQPHIRLETLESTAVRSVICCTYTTLVIAIALAALTELGFDRSQVTFNVTECFSDHASEDATKTLHGGEACYRSCIPDDPQQEWTTAWTGIAEGISPQAGGFTMTLQIHNINETSENINTHLSFGSKLFGSAKDKAPHDTVAFNDSCSLAIRSGSDKWSRVFTSETQHTVSLNCRAGGNCPDTEIFDTRSISWGRSKGGFKSYLVNTLFKFGENDEGFEYFDKHAANVVMKLSYRRAGFRAFVIGTRGILALLSLIFLVVWGHLTNKYYHRAAPEGGIYANAKRCCSRAEFWHTWLPQRRWVFWMGVSMFWWQNPIFVFTELAGESGAVASVITESISSVSWAMVFAMWILMVDGLGQPDPYRREFSSKFYIPKILFVVLYCIVTISMHILRQPELVHDSSNRSVFGGQQSNDTLLRVTLGMVITYIVLLLAWVFWFFHSLMKTRKVLLKLPYARTRFQQLTFRFLVWQTSVVVIFTIVINAIPFLRWCVMLLRSSGSDSSSNSDSQSNAARLSSLLQNVSEGFQPIGAYLLVSVYSYFLLYCYLPPKSSRIPTTVMERLEHGITNFLGVVTGSGTDSNTRPFSFEDGCWLFDFAWAAYFDPPPSIRVDADPANALSVDEESGLSPTDSSAGDLDPVPHGFHIEGFIYSKATDTVAIVFRRNWRVVLAFRGTVSYKNVVTDVKFARKAAEFSTANSNNLPANIPGVRQVLPLIHQGFWDAYASIKDPLHNVLRSALANAGEDAKLYCTGHSLGGALATIAAYDCRTMVLDICAQHRAFGIDRGQSNLMGNIRSFFEEVSGSFRRKFSSLTTPSRSHQDFGETSLSGGLSSQLVHNDSLGKSNHWYESTGTTPMEKSSGEVMEERRDQLDTAEAGANELEKSHNRRLSEIIQTLPQDSSDCGLGIVPEENNSNSAANLLSNTNNRREPTDDSQEEGRVIVYTFGSPRVGNRAFASQYEDHIPWTFRVATDGDLITGIPKFCFMYKHVGTHVWMDKGGNIVVDPSFVETTFISRRKTSLDMHSSAGYRQSLLLARIQQGLPLSERMKEELGIEDEKQAQMELLGNHAQTLMDGDRDGSPEWR